MSTEAAVGTEKPLHVRVAEALGLVVKDESRWCSGQCIALVTIGGDLPTVREGRHHHERWLYERHDWEGDSEWYPVPRYDEDWSVTGPLIEKYGIDLCAATRAISVKTASHGGR